MRSEFNETTLGIGSLLRADWGPMFISMLRLLPALFTDSTSHDCLCRHLKASEGSVAAIRLLIPKSLHGPYLTVCTTEFDMWQWPICGLMLKEPQHKDNDKQMEST